MIGVNFHSRWNKPSGRIALSCASAPANARHHPQSRQRVCFLFHAPPHLHSSLNPLMKDNRYFEISLLYHDFLCLGFGAAVIGCGVIPGEGGVKRLVSWDTPCVCAAFLKTKSEQEIAERWANKVCMACQGA